VEEALSVVTKKKNKKVMEKPSTLVPFIGKVEGWCDGLKLNHGIYSQCTNKPLSSGELCKTCKKQADTNEHGKPNNGLASERVENMENWRDPKNRCPTHFGNIMRKMGLNVDEVKRETKRIHELGENDELPSEIFEMKKQNRGRPKKANPIVSDTDDEGEPAKKQRGRPKKTSKKLVDVTSDGDDLIVTLVAQAKQASEEQSDVSESESESESESVSVSESEFESESGSDSETKMEENKSVKKAKKSKLSAEEKKAAKEAEKQKKADEKKAAKEAEKQKKADEKKAAKEAEKQKKAKKGKLSEEEKEAAKAAKEAEKQKKADEKKAAKEAEKQKKADEKKAAKEAEKQKKADEKKAAKEAETVIATVQSEDELTAEEAEEEEVRVEAKTIGGVEYLIDDEGMVYDKNTQEPIGMYVENEDRIEEFDEPELTRS